MIQISGGKSALWWKQKRQMSGGKSDKLGGGKSNKGKWYIAVFLGHPNPHTLSSSSLCTTRNWPMNPIHKCAELSIVRWSICNDEEAQWWTKFNLQRWPRQWLLWIRLGRRHISYESIYWSNHHIIDWNMTLSYLSSFMTFTTTTTILVRCGSVVAMMLFLILLFTAFKANDNLRVIQLNEEVEIVV